eukprot:COSAG01_NODE_7104_length_3352_cov_6.179834_1_plen_83_part_00
MAAASYCKARPATKAARDAMISADSSTDDCCTPVDRPLLPKPSGRKRVRPPPRKGGSDGVLLPRCLLLHAVLMHSAPPKTTD